jgi:hypothetical protein
MQYIGAILAASQHPDDSKFLHQAWTKRLLSEMPPSLLFSTMHHIPQLQGMSRILDIVRTKLKNPERAPPLRIAVVGGTFAEGEGCNLASVSIPQDSVMANPSYCAWPYRLQSFLNALVGEKNNLVEVTNLSEEGTDTGFMIPLMRNWIYPKHLLPHGPDVIINAYGRHDYETYGEGAANLKQTVVNEMNTFLRAVESSHPCGDAPIVIHLDDIGVELEKKIFSIRHKPAIQRALKADHQSNFAMAAHMAMTWILAFNALEGSLQFCQAQPKEVVPRRIPPPHCQDPSTGDSSCPFGFYASPQGTVTRVTQFQKYLRPYVTRNSGWEVLSEMSTGWSRKTGLVAIDSGAQLILQIKNIPKEVRYFHLMTLKSNVLPWRDGTTQFRVAILAPGKNPIETSFKIDGSHKSNKQEPEHITHHYNMDFGEQKAPIGSDIMLSLELVEGTNFKVLGLMLCS